MPKQHSYREDLAHIHDVGYGQFAEQAGATLLKLLPRRKKGSGLVVDLGCGSGILARLVDSAGFRVRGYDLSPAMVAIARMRVPAGEFFEESFLTARFPSCVAVTAIGEVFNYLFDRRNTPSALFRLFGRIQRALEPRGVLLFDVAMPGRVPGEVAQHCRSGEDWACLSQSEEDRTKQILTRRITSFRHVGPLYRRDSEVHRLRLYTRAELVKPLRAAGFRVHVLRGYDDLKFPKGYAAFVCRKQDQ
jgi:SAM-dependent methyltransferase